MDENNVKDEIKLEWTFFSKAKANEKLMSLLTGGEEILQCYRTVRDQAALTNKRILIMDKQGITGKKTEIFSIPYRSIDMWSTENTGLLFDFSTELELWTKSGRFKISLSPDCDIREFDRILSSAILQ